MDLPESPTTRRAVLGGVGTVVAGAGVVYGASQLESSSGGEPPSGPAGVQFHSSSESTSFGIDLQGHPLMGAMDAPLDMYYWSDYQCPFCRRFESNTFPDIVENHVRTGDVRVAFIEYPYLGEASMTAAVMDRCVWQQVRDDRPGRYWEWHSAVFDAQAAKNSGWAARENLLAITEDVPGIDASAVDTCMGERREEFASAIGRDVQVASQLGIRGSPAFVLYNRETEQAGKLVGAQPYDRFDEAITTVRNA